MYGDIGHKLVRRHATRKYVFKANNDQVEHAKREKNLAHLLPYEAETVRSIVREVRDLNREFNSILEPLQGSFNIQSQDPSTACALLIDQLSMRRNKRCLLAYHRIRTDKFDRLVWQGVDLVSNDVNHEGRQPDAQQPEDENSLSPEEEEYVRLYGDLISAYKGQWSDIDLTGSLEPPKDLFIDVRVLKDAGEIQTEYGYVGAASAGRYILLTPASAINLTKNSQFYVRQGDVERLIQQGYLQKLS